MSARLQKGEAARNRSNQLTHGYFPWVNFSNLISVQFSFEVKSWRILPNVEIEITSILRFVLCPASVTLLYRCSALLSSFVFSPCVLLNSLFWLAGVKAVPLSRCQSRCHSLCWSRDPSYFLAHAKLLSNEGIYRRWHGLEPLRRKQLISHDVFDPSRYYHWVIFAKSPKMCVLSASRKCLVHLCLIFQMYLRCQHAFPCNDTTFSIILEMH